MDSKHIGAVRRVLDGYDDDTQKTKEIALIFEGVCQRLGGGTPICGEWSHVLSRLANQYAVSSREALAYLFHPHIESLRRFPNIDDHDLFSLKRFLDGFSSAIANDEFSRAE